MGKQFNGCGGRIEPSLRFLSWEQVASAKAGFGEHHPLTCPFERNRFVMADSDDGRRDRSPLDDPLPMVFAMDLTLFRQHRRGVYFLRRQGVVVYIGQSRNIPRRIWEHMGGDKEFDAAEGYKVPDDQDLDSVETALIQEFKPEYNRGRPHGFLAWGTIHAKLKAAGIRQYNGRNIKPFVTKAVAGGMVRADASYDGLTRYNVADVSALLGVPL